MAAANIWSAALVAAECRAYRPTGHGYVVRWELEKDHLRFVARHEVVVQPFGVRLRAGEVLEVRWEPNASSYAVAVRSAS